MKKKVAWRSGYTDIFFKRGQRISFNPTTQPKLQSMKCSGTVSTDKGQTDLLWVKTDRVNGKSIKPTEMCIHKSCIERIVL